MEMYKKIEELCKENKTNVTAMCKDLGITRAALSELKSGRTKSLSADKLIKIAEFFGVSPSYLTGETDQKEKAPTSSGAGSNAVFLENNKIYMIPLYESVSAGFGAGANDSIIDYMPCYINNPSEAEEYLCIRVTGDSMFPKIEDGDIIQVHRQTSVDSGSLAVVLLDGEEGLVKKVVYGDDWIELHSINPMYPVQRFEGAEVMRLRVVGLVKKIIKEV